MNHLSCSQQSTEVTAGPRTAPRPIHVIAVLTVGTVLLAAFVLAELTWLAREAAWSQARGQAARVAAVLAERTSRTIVASRVLLDTYRRHVMAVGVENLAGSRQEWETMRELAKGLPEPGSLWVNGPDAKVILTSIAWPTPPVNAAGREHFEVHRTRQVPFYLAAAIRNRANGLYSWPMSMAIRNQEGDLLATTNVALDLDAFTDLAEAADMGDGSVMAVVREDGRLLLGRPASALREDSLDNWPLPDEGTTAARVLATPADGIERQLVYRRLADQPVWAVAGIPTAVIEARWHSRARSYGLIALAALVPLLAVALIGVRVARREERAHARLAATNQWLELRVAERTGALASALKEVEQAKRAAEQANLGKTRLLAATGHDLRQSFQAIRLFHGVLEGSLPEGRDRDVLGKLGQAIGTGESMLGSLLDIARLDSGRVELAIAPVALSDLFESVADECVPAAAQKGLRFRWRCPDLTVMTDRTALRRVLGNLAANAIRYTDKGGVLLAARRRGRSLSIEVWDTGIGIAPDHLEAIFDEFYRVGQERNGGMGLGLSIVKRFCGLLKYKLSVRSRPGRGSVFAVRMPLADG